MCGAIPMGPLITAGLHHRVAATRAFDLSRRDSAATVTAIVVGEVYTLLIVALTIVFRPRAAQAMGLALSRRRHRHGIRRMRRCVPLDGGDSIGWWAVALVELDRDLEGNGVR